MKRLCCLINPEMVCIFCKEGLCNDHWYEPTDWQGKRQLRNGVCGKAGHELGFKHLTEHKWNVV